MTTLNEMITIIKAENPTLQVGNDEQGYTQLSEADYETTISEWADTRLKKEAKAAADEAAAIQAIADKAVATAKLAALGLTTDDLKALGLGAN
jgi:hypothetical protein